MAALRALVTAAGLVALWQLVVWATELPPYILPGPAAVFTALVERGDLIAQHGVVTLAEILLGLALGLLLGAGSALVIAYVRPARRWLMPLLVMSQALPVFAIAPLLVLWFGYGLWSKVVMAALIIYFPVAATFVDGLRRTEPGWLDLAQTMTAGRRGADWTILWRIRVPAALPALASGLRVAAAVAPIGAIVGEWVGSSAGLGYLMLHANGRMQIDLLFAALAVLATLAIVLYFAVDIALKRALEGLPDTNPSSD